VRTSVRIALVDGRTDTAVGEGARINGQIWGPGRIALGAPEGLHGHVQQ
jgi:hypothetical protein